LLKESQKWVRVIRVLRPAMGCVFEHACRLGLEGIVSKRLGFVLRQRSNRELDQDEFGELRAGAMAPNHNVGTGVAGSCKSRQFLVFT
jgi:hypothetical protein